MATPQSFAGNLARVTLHSQVIANLTNWSCSATTDTAESTPMGPADTDKDFRWAKVESTFTGWTASADGYIVGAGSDLGHDDGDSDLLSGASGSDLTSLTPVTLDLFFHWVSDGTNERHGYLSGDAYLAGMSWSTDANDIETITYNFQGTGQLSFKKA